MRTGSRKKLLQHCSVKQTGRFFLRQTPVLSKLTGNGNGTKYIRFGKISYTILYFYIFVIMVNVIGIRFIVYECTDLT